MDKMKSLVVFYSRTGTTKKVAETIADILKCDIEEILDTKKRTGVLGYIRSVLDAVRKKLTVIKEVQKVSASYGILIIGTPIWMNTMSTPIRTYITQYKDGFNKVAFFAQAVLGTAHNTIKEMEGLCEKKPIGVLGLKKEEVTKAEYLRKTKGIYKGNIFR